MPHRVKVLQLVSHNVKDREYKRISQAESKQTPAKPKSGESSIPTKIRVLPLHHQEISVKRRSIEGAAK